MKVLINNVHSTNSTALVMLLRRITSVSLEIYGSDVEEIGFVAASNFVDRYFQSPPIEDTKEFTDFLVTLCENEQIDLVIPSSDNEVRYWAYYSPDIPVKVFTPTENVVRLFCDKRDATFAVKDIGLDVPKVIDNLFDRNLSKIIFRKRTSVCSQGIEVVDFTTEKFIPNHFNHEWFAQEYINGTEYAVDVFCDQYGKPKIIIPRKRLEMRSGATIRSQLINHKGIISACKKLYDSFCIPGLSDVEFIESEDGLYFIEMNMRFSASGICGIVGSFNYLEQYIEHFYYEKPLEDFAEYMKYICWNSIVTRYYEDSIYPLKSGKS